MPTSPDPSKVTTADLAALADKSHLHDFEGHEVVATTIAITSAGDGLSAALAVDPNELPIGEEVFVVLRTVVKQVRYEVSKDDDDLYVRKHVLKTVDGTIIEAQVVKKAVEAQAERIRLAREHAAGVQRLFQEEPSNPVTDALLALHDKGQHKELAEGCPACDAEKAAEMAEHPTAKKSAGASKKSAADKLAAAPTVKD